MTLVMSSRGRQASGAFPGLSSDQTVSWSPCFLGTPTIMSLRLRLSHTGACLVRWSPGQKHAQRVLPLAGHPRHLLWGRQGCPRLTCLSLPHAWLGLARALVVWKSSAAADKRS